jgi:hypothetical protein
MRLTLHLAVIKGIFHVWVSRLAQSEEFSFWVVGSDGFFSQDGRNRSGMDVYDWSAGWWLEPRRSEKRVLKKLEMHTSPRCLLK